MDIANILSGITFDDVLLVPVKSSVRSRSLVNLDTKLTRGISLKIPLIPANMDTVTESLMAVTMAREGGIGIIHRFQSIEREVEEVKKVKKVEDLVLRHPLKLKASDTLEKLWYNVERFNISSFVITNEAGVLLGLVTKRDYQFEYDPKIRVDTIMTPLKKLVTAPEGTSIEKAKEILHKRRVEKLPLIGANNKFCGLYTIKDIINYESKPNALRDSKGRLMVGASIGVTGDFMERASELDKADVDLLLVDVAHGHADHVMSAIKKLRKAFPRQQIIAGNVATYEGALDLIKCDVDGIKVGIGPGSVCTTRIVAGVGVPQLTAIADCAKACREAGIPLIADGGVKNSGDAVKALAMGADVVMAGNIFAGTLESPGEVISIDGKKYKTYHGSSTYAAAKVRNKLGDFDKFAKSQVTRVEGAEAVVAYKGSVCDLLPKIVGGLQSGLSYCGAQNLEELRRNARFVTVTANGVRENNHHDVLFAV